jgi:outer membrane protein assembly factor BamB
MPSVTWSFSTGGPSIADLSVAYGMVYIGGGYMSALDAATGELRWRYSAGAGWTPPPLLADGAAYVGYSPIWPDTAKPGAWSFGVYAMDPATGQVRWTYPASLPTTPRAVSPGTVFASRNDRHVCALDAASGDLRWAAPTPQWIAGVTVADATVYAKSGMRKLSALDAATGEVRWTYATQAPVTSPPVVTDGSVYAGSQDETLRALDAATGQLRWSFPTGGVIQAPPVTVGSTVYVGTLGGVFNALGGVLYALEQ